jgi:hypothetical protein
MLYLEGGVAGGQREGLYAGGHSVRGDNLIIEQSGYGVISGEGGDVIRGEGGDGVITCTPVHSLGHQKPA